MEQKEIIRKLQQQEIAKIEKILKAMNLGDGPKTLKVFNSTPTEKVVIDGDTFPSPADLFDEPITSKLGQAIELRSHLLTQLAKVTEEIESQQVIIDEDMKAFNFYRVTGGDTYQVYRRKDTFSREWEVILDLSKPKRIKINRRKKTQETENSFTFYINGLEEFRTLLIQLEII